MMPLLKNFCTQIFESIKGCSDPHPGGLENKIFNRVKSAHKLQNGAEVGIILSN